MLFKYPKQKKTFAIGEEQIKSCIVAASNEILGSKAAQKLQDVPLSNDMVQMRIVDMAKDVEDQVIEEIKKWVYFAIQLDESPDVSNRAILFCFVRYKGEVDFEEEFLCCLGLPGRITSSEIFRSLNEYFLEHSLDCGKCVGVCTDGAANMTGCRSGMIEKLLIKRCLLLTVYFTESTCLQKMSPELNNVLNGAVKIANEIRSRALNSRFLTALCESMDSQHQHLLFQAEVRWLSRGHVLSRLFELKEEAKQFLQEAKSSLTELFLDEIRISKLEYLADIFRRLNELSISLQVFSTNIFGLRSKTDALKKKLALWDNRVQKGDLEMFPNLHDFFTSADMNRKELLCIITIHLNSGVASPKILGGTKILGVQNV